MSDYEFVDWFDIVYKRNRNKLGSKDFNKQDVENYIKEGNQPDLFKFLQHHVVEASNALDAGIKEDYRWDALQPAVVKAFNAVKEGDTSLIAKAFYDLGRAREALDHATHAEMIVLSKSRISTINRETPLKMINLGREYAKKAAQEIAQKKWDDDTEQNTRLAEMCKTVYEEIIKNHKTFMEFLPENPNDMKKWLRPIAPDWAKKGGRPRKRRKN